MRSRKLIADENSALHAIHMATEEMGQPATRTAQGIRVSKTTGMLRKRTVTAELLVYDGRLHYQADSDSFDDWVLKVIDNLPPGILDDHGIPKATRGVSPFEWTRRIDQAAGATVTAVARCSKALGDK